MGGLAELLRDFESGLIDRRKEKKEKKRKEEEFLKSKGNMNLK